MFGHRDSRLKGRGSTEPSILKPCTGNSFGPLYASCWIPAGTMAYSQIQLLAGRSVKGLIKRQRRELKTHRKSTVSGALEDQLYRDHHEAASTSGARGS